MDITSNTVLVTGGASGIGLALAQRFLLAGSEVILCGRRQDKLQEAKNSHPTFHIHAADLSIDSERVSFHQWVTQQFPQLNVLVNNAGIQRRVQLDQNESWAETREEIAINLDAPIHLSRLFIPHLLKQRNPAILNVTSGLSFIPLTNVPIYCSTKAALHSFTQSLRHQLAKTPIQVIEIIPPAVDTDLGGVGLHKFGVPVDEFVDHAMAGVKNGEVEIAYGFSEQSRNASREEREQIFTRLNQPR